MLKWFYLDLRKVIFMKLATMTSDFRLYTKKDEEKLTELYDAGFRCIDLSLYSEEIKVYMGDDWKERLKRLKAHADSLGMEFVQAHSPGGNPLKKDERWENLVNSTIRSIEVCGELGIKNTVVHFGYDKGVSKDESFEKNCEFFRLLLPTAERCGVNVLAENSTKANMGERYYPNSAKDLLEFLDFVDHPMLHVCWDTGHANCEGAQYDEIMTLGDELYAIHYNDNHGKKDEHLIPYFGTLNHDEVINALIDSGYKGYFTFECGSSLITPQYWLGGRREFDRDTRTLHPELFMQRQLEKLLYDTGKHLLSTYGLYEV